MMKKKARNTKSKLHTDILEDEPYKLVKFHRNSKYASSRKIENK